MSESTVIEEKSRTEPIMPNVDIDPIQSVPTGVTHGYDYDEELRLLATFRNEEEKATLKIKELKEQFESSPDYQAAMELLRNAQEYADKMTQAIKCHATGDYLDTGTKHPHAEINIRLISNLIYEKALALDYCRHNLVNALKLDYQFFEKHARAVATTAPLDFVKIEMQPKATISTDLSAYLDNKPAVVDIDLEKIEPVPY